MIRDFAAQKEIEVDVLISFQLGGREYRTVVESRNEARAQGPAWIRELATKRDDCRVDRISAASSSGFTSGARPVARKHNVGMIDVAKASPDAIIESVIPVPHVMFAVAGCSIANSCGIYPPPPFDIPREGLTPANIRIELPTGKTLALKEATWQAREAVRSHFMASLVPSEPIAALPKEREGESPIDLALVFGEGTRLVLPGGQAWQINKVTLDACMKYSMKYLNGREAFLYGQRPVEEASGEVLDREVRVTFAKGSNVPAVHMRDAKVGPPSTPSAAEFQVYYKRSESDEEWIVCPVSGTAAS
ncbi:MAG TPA: hypothetical protein VNA25_15385 [Phycisphaerae bacterium]|nr:hypothetical protein [Phycisphaerae bacterium]